MADVETAIFTPALYELGDPDGNIFNTTSDYAEMLVYFNRALREGLDPVLSAMSSDWVLNEDTATTLAEDDNSVSVPTGSMCIRDVWIDATTQLDKVDNIDEIYWYRRRHSDESGKPTSFAGHGTTIEFNKTADQDYSSMYIYYDKRSTALAYTGTEPYNGEFNGPLTAMVVLMCQKRQERNMMTTAEIYDFFLKNAMGHVLRKKFSKQRTQRADF